MIIGNGLVATAFKPYFAEDPEILAFASGVSNSRENREQEFLREKKLLVENLNQGKFLLYFSTCSINDPELHHTPYVAHKQEMEALVRTQNRFAIFRLPQVVGHTPNSHTLTNYLYHQIVSGNAFQVWRHAKRNLIDVDDVASIVAHLVRNAQADGLSVNIASPFSIAIPELVSIFESVLNKKANYSLVDAGGSYLIDVDLVTRTAGQCGVGFGENYIENLIRKYYGG